MFGPAGGDLLGCAWGTLGAGGVGIVGNAAAGGAVAVLGVVEALERAGALAEMLKAREALLAEEALVERVVEVLDRAVAPRFASRDEDGRASDFLCKRCW